MGFFSDKKILVTGGTGLIGQPLVKLLLSEGAIVRIVSLDDPTRAHPEAEFLALDLTRYDNCLIACKDQEIVFNLVGIKGSPKMMLEQPASYFVPSLMFNTNMMSAAHSSGVDRYMFTSSIGVYAPAEVFKEDDVWQTFPSPNDRFGGWQKRIGELQAEAYNIQYKWDKVTITRPANVYGPFDNFDPQNAMVVPSLITRACSGENPLTVWGDGSAIRDFIYAEDCARAMMLVVEKNFTKPINLGSGSGNTVREVVEAIVKQLPQKPEVVWDTSKPTGDKRRVMDITRLQSLGFVPSHSLEQGIAKSLDWYLKNRDLSSKRHNPFTSKTI